MRGARALVGFAVGCGSVGGERPALQVSDADGDGYTAAVDCDDDDPSIHPDAPDPFYDGIDSNCDGADDFDQDGDGHRSADYGGDDCDDTDPAISPSAPEIPYDGIDNDCDPATPDDDLDRDGFGVAEDCDDLDPSVHPGALEHLGDALDSDCDGNPDGSPFAYGDLLWVDPSVPRLVAADDRLVLVVTAAAVTSPAWFTAGASGAGVVMSLDPSGDSGALPVAEAAVWRSGDRIGAPDVAVDGDALWVGVSWETDGQSWLGLHRLGGPGWGVDEAVVRSGPAVVALRIDVAVDGGVGWLCAAGASWVGALRGGSDSEVHGVAADGSRGCASAGARFTTVDASGVPTGWQADPGPTVVSDQPLADQRWSWLREAEGVITAGGVGGGLVVAHEGTVVPLLGSRTVRDGQAVVADDGTIWLAAVVARETGDEVLLAWGLPGEMSESWLPVRVPGGAAALEPTGVSLALIDGRVVVAVSGRDSPGIDAVGWVALGR